MGSKYTALEYIESSGTQYIDTGVSGNNDNLTISVKFNMLAFTQYRGVFGNYVGESSNCFRMILTNTDNGRYYVYSNTAAGTGSTTLSNLQINTVNEVVLARDKAVVNGVEKAITNTTKGTDNDGNIFIFTQSGKANQGSTMRLYSFKIYDNGVLIRDFVPCVDESGVGGLYDKVENKFYPNAGSGTFILGSPTGEALDGKICIGLPSKKVTLKNLVPAMGYLSFEVRSSSGTCEMSTAHSKYGSTALCNSGVAGYNEMYSMSTAKFKLIPSHLYYACAEVYQEEKLGTFDFFWPSGSPSMFGGKSPGDAGTWKKWYNVTNRSNFAEGEYPIRLDFNNGGVAGKMWYDGVMLVDLTEAFGAGNEPTVAWCNENIAYFTGEKSIEVEQESSVAREIVGAYIGVDGTACRVRKAYIGDENGIARLVFDFGELVVVDPEKQIKYVSLGDSIAAGHAIDDFWEAENWRDTQYDRNGHKPTKIVPGCYTELLANELVSTYGRERVVLNSFAQSGETVASLIDKLNDKIVRDTLAEADLVTVCIGANDVLGAVNDESLTNYFMNGDLSYLNNYTANNLAILDDDSNPKSYKALFDKLCAINPNAKYVFTTVYNPYKFLWVDDNKVTGGFFKGLIDKVPNIELVVLWQRFNLRNTVRDIFLGEHNGVWHGFCTRINYVGEWTEGRLAGTSSFRGLNQILTDKINAYRSTNPNFFVVDTKNMFDSFPDKTDNKDDKDYSDLVNVEFTRGTDVTQLDWGALWQDEYGDDSVAYWIDLFVKHNLNFESVLYDILGQTVVKVIMPNIDPHPETYGQYVLSRSFAREVFQSTIQYRTITFHANGASGTMSDQTVAVVDNNPSYANINAPTFIPVEGYRFAGWNTKADGSGTAYTDGQSIKVTSNLTLYAQWTLKIHTLTYKTTVAQALTPNDDSRNYHQLWINGSLQPQIAVPSTKTISVPYGTPVGIVVESKYGSGGSYITRNGNMVSGKSTKETYDFVLKGDMTINFEWHWGYADWSEYEDWVCFITG